MQKVTEALKRQSWITRDRNNNINRPVRTACAVVQHYNAATYITIHKDCSATLPLPQNPWL